MKKPRKLWFQATVIVALLAVLWAWISREPPGAMAQEPPELLTAERMALNLAATEVPLLRDALGVSGDDVIIAVIDTGVDTGHPAFSPYSFGRRKIVDWVDFSGRGRFFDRANREFGTEPAEGDVFLEPAQPHDETSIETPLGVLKLGNWRSASGTYRVGVFFLGRLSEEAFLGKKPVTPAMVVVALDTTYPGIYDTVLVDTTGDLDVADEVPLRVYREGGLATRIYFEDGSHASLVLADLHPEGTLANLGFDGGGHGTQVAGIAAGFDPEFFSGVAPGAQIMAIKALSSGGRGSWSQMEEAIRYAASRGAHVLSISVASLVGPKGIGWDEAALLDRAAQECQCLIVLAAGNDGPGVGSAVSIGALVVGAYYTPDMVQWDTGYRPAHPGVWYFSGGNIVPSVLAPGASPAPVPDWLSPYQYQNLEGTSAAAPHVAGIAALLIQAARAEGLQLGGGQVREAIKAGAAPLPGFQPLEQGHGVVQAMQAWNALIDGVVPMNLTARLQGIDPVRSVKADLGHTNLRNVTGPGFWLLEGLEEDLEAHIQPDAGWVRADKARILLPPGVPRALTLESDAGLGPGLYSAWVHLSSGPARATLLHTHVEPLPLKADKGSLRLRGTLAPGRWERHLVQVPPGVTQMRVRLGSPAAPGWDRPPLQMYIYRPDGFRWLEMIEAHRDDEPIDFPVPGVWELVVYAPFPGQYQDYEQVDYTVSVDTSGVRFPMEPWWVVLDDAGPAVKTMALPLSSGYWDDLTVQVHGPTWNVPRSEELIFNTWRLEPARYEFDVEMWVGSVEILATSPAGSNLDLYLYRKGIGGRLELVHESTGGGSWQFLSVQDPEPGVYVVWGETGSLQPVPVAISIRTLPPPGNEARVYTRRGSTLGGTTIWAGHVRFSRPPGRGRFYALLTIRGGAGEQGPVLGALPVVIDSRLPQSVIAAQAAPVGEQGYWLTVSVYDVEAGGRVPTVLWIDEDPYDAPSGQVSVFRTGSPDKAVRVWALPPGRAAAEAWVVPRQLFAGDESL